MPFGTLTLFRLLARELSGALRSWCPQRSLIGCSLCAGAPTGSGKTVAGELALFRLFREHPGKKAVYIAPLKVGARATLRRRHTPRCPDSRRVEIAWQALVRERVDDWKKRLEATLGRRVVELTGDVTPDGAR